MSDAPLVSVIIPIFNGERFLAETVESVLAQTYRNWELLLVDDGSRDTSPSIVREFVERTGDRVRYLEHKGHANRGHSASRNLGIEHARGDYVALLDADDVWLPNKLREQVAIMEAHPTAAMIFGRTQFWYSWTGRPEDSRRDRFYTFGMRPDTLIEPPRLLPLLMENHTQTASASDALIRRRVFDEIGRFEESFRGVHEDYAFFAKIYANAPVFIANEWWARYRQHPDSIMAIAKKDGTLAQARLEFLRWLENYLCEHNVTDPVVQRTLKSELHHSRHPLLFRIPRRSRELLPAAKTRLRNALPPSLKRPLKTVWARRRTRAPQILILMYHRICSAALDPYRTCVAPRHFEEHLQIIQGWGEVLSLSQLARQRRLGRLPRRGFVVTFDDGYHDNLEVAKPLLERHSIPATVFVTSGAVGATREFWWDELERLLLRPGSLPERLTLGKNGSVRHWELAEAVSYSEQESRNRNWNAYHAIDALAPRQRFFQSVYQFVSQLYEPERQHVMDQLLDWTGSKAEIRPDRRILSSAELAELAHGEWIEVGAHTVTHPALPSLPISRQFSEMYQSKTQIERLLGQPVTSFAYPHGAYSADSLIAVREAGFECACTTVHQPLRLSADCFRLPRVQVEDWDGNEFTRKLEDWFQR